MMDETDIDDGGRPEAELNEGNELKHSRWSFCPLKGIGDTMVLIPSSHGKIYRRKVVTKSVHKNDENRQFITVKYVNDPQSWLTMT